MIYSIFIKAAAVVGLDLGMTLGPVLGSVLFGELPLSMFYPVMLLTIPLILFIYLIKRTEFG